ncbi:MAG TPA: hypothetical protein DDZ29_07635, partial [Alteromonas mediterranea]|nr:hypothetical protein [Alteromonas mediterranea]
NKEYGHFILALREGLASFLASFWEIEREQPFLHSHASLGNLPAPSEWAMIYADWYKLTLLIKIRKHHGTN